MVPEPCASTEKTAEFGMRLFLVSLAVLFAATLVGYGVVRMHGQNSGLVDAADTRSPFRLYYAVPAWKTPTMPDLPTTLWVSTVLIVASSFSFVAGHRAIRRGWHTGLAWGLGLSLGLGVAFLVFQIVNWLDFYQVYVQSNSVWGLHAFTFYLLTALHAAHVIGGLIPLALTWRKSLASAYRADSHLGVKLVGMYWHFLGAMWLIVFAALSV